MLCIIYIFLLNNWDALILKNKIDHLIYIIQFFQKSDDDCIDSILMRSTDIIMNEVLSFFKRAQWWIISIHFDYPDRFEY